ncbi:MAG: hypothetical protein HZB68_04515 [Candidatus Aenigmarchaeota archaeon]|nr:hypothetical protein [Candidatus Aenigmarchaeota archaeon]
MAYQQRCVSCKKTMVLVPSRWQKPLCTKCEMGDLDQEIEDPAWKKFFAIDPALYEKSSFLRSIKRSYLNRGMLTDKQREMFLKVVAEGAQGPPPRKRAAKAGDGTGAAG